MITYESMIYVSFRLIFTWSIYCQFEKLLFFLRYIKCICTLYAHHYCAEVLYGMTQGKQNEEIAIILGISYFTVKNHAKRIFSLLGVETRSAAMAMATPYL